VGGVMLMTAKTLPTLTKSNQTVIKKPRPGNEFLISIGHTVHVLNIKHGMQAVR
jgi:hypothetical protein